MARQQAGIFAMECLEIELALVRQTAVDLRGWRLAGQSRNSTGLYQLSNSSGQVASLQVALWIYEENGTTKPLSNNCQIRLEQARMAGSATARLTIDGETYSVDLETGLGKSSKSPGTTIHLRRGPASGRSTLAQALMESGNQWEERLLDNLQRAGIAVAIAEGSQKLSHRRHSPAQTLDLLKKAPLGYLYQTTLVAPASFYARYGLSNVALSQSFPDLIHISRDDSGKKLLRIIDAKQSEDVKLSHKIQVCFYSLILRAIIEEQLPQADLVVSDLGGVWLGDRLEYQKFMLKPLERYVSGVFLHDLDNLSARSVADVPFNLSSNCQYCEFLPYCNSEAERARSIQQLPRQSEAKKALVSSLFATPPDIEEAAAILAKRWPGLGEPSSRSGAPDTAWFLRQDLDTFKSKVNRPYGFSVVSTPLACDVLCTLSLLQHSVTRRPVAFHLAVHVPVKKLAWLHAQGPDAFVALPDGTGVYCCRTVDHAQNKGPESWRLAEALGTALAVLIDQLDAHNQKHKTTASQLSLLIAVASHAEASWLKDWLLSSHQDAAFFALGNLFSDAVILHAGRPVRFSTDLKSCSSDTLQVLEQVQSALALSLPVVGDWDDLLGAFGLRQALKLDTQALLQRWFDGAGSGLASELLTRASVLSQLVGKLQALLGPFCSKLQTPFVARRLTELRTPQLQKLAFLVEYEQFSQSRKLIEGRKYLPLLSVGAVPSGRFLELRLASSVKSGNSIFARFSMQSEPTTFLAISENSIGLSWLLAPRAHVLALTAYDDFAFRTWFRPLGYLNRLPVAFAQMDDVIDGLLCLRLSPTANFSCEPGDYVLVPRNVDYLSDIHFDMLRELDWVHSFASLLKTVPPEVCLQLRAEVLGKLQAKVKKTVTWQITLPADSLTEFAAVAPSLHLTQVPTEPPTFLPAVAAERPLFRAILFAASQRCPLLTSSLGQQDVSETGTAFLANPVHWGAAPPADLFPEASAAVDGILAGLPPALCTASQRGQISEVLGRRLSLLWGPPGTGKTHVTSVLCAALASAHKKAKAPTFHIIVVAFTHSAIKTLLDRLLELQPDLPLGRLVGRLAQREKDPTELVTSLSTTTKQPLNFLKKHRVCVIAGTVWAVRSAFSDTFEQEPRFELLVVDEASQMRLTDFCTVLRYVEPRAGRVVLAGDHRQMPPIIHADYTELPPATQRLAGSVFQFVLESDSRRELLTLLNENWRMTAELCGFFSRTVYATGGQAPYRPATPQIGDRTYPQPPPGSSRLFDPLPTELAALRVCGDPSSLVTVLLKDDPHADPAAAATLLNFLVRAIAHDYSLTQPERQARLWRETLLVVCPHHQQRKALLSLLGDTAAAVKTVETAQGHERDVVLVDYGLLDAARIDNSTEFVFSLNRLNVAMSRARLKCIVVLSEALLRSRRALAKEHLAEGLALMQQLVGHCRERRTLVELEPGALALLPAGKVADETLARLSALSLSDSLASPTDSLGATLSEMHLDG